MEREGEMNRELREEIERDCTRLSAAFAYHIDHREYEALANLFTPEGVWLRHGVLLSGRSEILAAMHARPANQFTRHVTTGHFFTSLTETTAASSSYNLSWASFDAEVLPGRLDLDMAMLLDFVDAYEKTPQGWLFSERITTPVLISDQIRAMLAAAHD